MGRHEDGRAPGFYVREQSVKDSCITDRGLSVGSSRIKQGRSVWKGLDDAQLALMPVLYSPFALQVALGQFQSVAELLSVTFIHRHEVEPRRKSSSQGRSVEVKAEFAGQVAECARASSGFGVSSRNRKMDADPLVGRTNPGGDGSPWFCRHH